MYLCLSDLVITTGANVVFANNKASVRGGALFLSLSAIYPAVGANLSFLNTTAGDKGGAIYVDPEVTLQDIVMVNADIIQ